MTKQLGEGPKSFVQKLTRAGARVYVHKINDEKEIVQCPVWVWTGSILISVLKMT